MSCLSPSHHTGYYTTFEEDRRTHPTAKKTPARILPVEEDEKDEEEHPVSHRHVRTRFRSAATAIDPDFCEAPPLSLMEYAEWRLITFTHSLVLWIQQVKPFTV
jgi:hypothetical protein